MIVTLRMVGYLPRKEVELKICQKIMKKMKMKKMKMER